MKLFSRPPSEPALPYPISAAAMGVARLVGSSYWTALSIVRLGTPKNRPSLNCCNLSPRSDSLAKPALMVV